MRAIGSGFQYEGDQGRRLNNWRRPNIPVPLTLKAGQGISAQLNKI